MSLLQETIDLSRLYGVKPTRHRGQNFLIDEKVYDDIIAAADLKKNETILEVGPGLGFLTLRLAPLVEKVVAVELDKKLTDALNNRLGVENVLNVSVFNGDVMNFNGHWAKKIAPAASENLAVVANLPYTITSTFLRFFIGGNKMNIMPARFVLMLQKEVAERIIAPAGKMSLLAISVQLYADPKIVRLVSKKAFWPSPEVDSAIISIVRTDRWLKQIKAVGGTDTALLHLARIGFSARRKMLKANLAAGFQIEASESAQRLESAGIALNARAQELGLEDWLRLLPLFI